MLPQGRYQSFVYGTVGSTFIRGGGYTFASCPSSVRRITQEPPIEFEQNQLVNKSGSISTVPSSRFRNQAASDWIINIDDNFEVDNAIAGYTPFGEVLVNGLDVVLVMAVTNPALYSDPLDSTGADYFPEPTNCQTPEGHNHIEIAMSVINHDADQPSGSYLSTNNELQVNILMPDDSYLSMPFAVAMDDSGQVTIGAKTEQVVEPDIQNPIWPATTLKLAL